jgi:hypothetical protein
MRATSTASRCRSGQRPACNRSQLAGAVQAEFTPFTGKYSLFGKLFAAYDFYAFVGPGVHQREDRPAPCGRATRGARRTRTNPDRYVCGISGVKIGPTFGVGVHSFFGQSVALGVELRT